MYCMLCASCNIIYILYDNCIIYIIYFYNSSWQPEKKEPQPGPRLWFFFSGCHFQAVSFARACTSYTSLHNTAPSSIPGLRAHAHHHTGAGPNWSQYCGPPVTIYTAIRGKELWPHWWLSWLKLRVRVQATSLGARLWFLFSSCHS